ncbi:hypothetical protein ACFLXE_07790 [Chloroflexota bacterium]
MRPSRASGGGAEDNRHSTADRDMVAERAFIQGEAVWEESWTSCVAAKAVLRAEVDDFPALEYK